jgi:hypothetical protein
VRAPPRGQVNRGRSRSLRSSFCQGTR